MKKYRFNISAGGVLLLAALYFFMDTSSFAALMLAAAAHELGHIAALRLCGVRIRGFSADMGGAVISRSGGLSAAQELVCLAAGPGGGLIYALAVSFVGGGVLLCSAGMSLVLSFFNLLPSLPLDGGRMVETIFGEKTAALCGLITASAVFVTGFALFTGGSGPALFFAGAILLVKNI